MLASAVCQPQPSPGGGGGSGESGRCCHLLVGQGVHVADDLRRHLAGVGGAVLEGSLHDGHDEGQRGSVDEVDKLGVQQCLQTRLRLPGRVSEGVQQDGSDGWVGGRRDQKVVSRCSSSRLS